MCEVGEKGAERAMSQIKISPADAVRLRGMGVMESDAAVDWAKTVVRLTAQKCDAEDRLKAALAEVETAREEAAAAARQTNYVVLLAALCAPVLAVILHLILGGGR